MLLNVKITSNTKTVANAKFMKEIALMYASRSILKKIILENEMFVKITVCTSQKKNHVGDLLNFS